MLSVGERLILLGEAKDGLLARTHMFLGFLKPAYFDEDIERVAQRLAKKYPEIPEGLDKTPGYSKFKDRSLEICSGLEVYFLNMANLSRLKQNVMQLISEISSKILELHWDVHCDLMSKFFDLLTGYVQLSFLAAKLPEPQLYTITYAHAYQLSKSSVHPDWVPVLQFVDGIDKPLVKLRNEFENLAFHIGASLKSMSGLFTMYSNQLVLANNQVFNLLDNPQALGFQEDGAMYKTLMQISRMKLWILFSYLICPAELKSDEARELLKVALKDCWFASIYREHVLDVHEEYDNLFNNYKSQKFKLSKHKDVLKACTSNEAIQDSVDTHASARRLLIAEVRNFMALAKDFPGITGPKMNVALAALRRCNDELHWYVTHVLLLSRSKNVNAKLKVETWKDNGVGDLIAIVEQLSRFLKEHNSLIRSYAFESIKIRLQDVQHMIFEITDSSDIAASVKELLNQFENDVETCKIDGDYSAFRNNVIVLQSILAESQSGITLRFSKQLMQTMSSLSSLSSNIDDLEGIIKEYGSIHYMQFFLDDYNAIFEDCLNNSLPVARTTVSIIRALDFFRFNLNKFCPEDQDALQASVDAQADKFISSLMKKLADLVRAVYLKEVQLVKQIIPNDASERLKSGNHKDAYAGYESQYSNRDVVIRLEEMKSRIIQICSAIRESGPFQIWNNVYSLQDYLAETCVSSLRSDFRQLLRIEGRLQRPYLVLTRFGCLLYSLETVSCCLNIRVPELVKQLIYSEAFSDTVPIVGNYVQCSLDPKDSKEDLGIVEELCEFYVNFAICPLEQHGILFSNVSRSFFTFDSDPKRPSPPHEFSKQSLHYSFSELKLLCRILGPYGLKYLEQKLMNVLFKLMRTLKEVLEADKATLPALAHRLSQTSVWYEAARKCRAYDDLLKTLLRFGVVFKFRSLLSKAYSEVVSEHFPCMKDVSQAFAARLNDSSQSPELRSFYSFNRDCGSLDIFSDASFLHMLRQVKGSKTDEGLWRMLPEELAFLFTCPEWRGATYVVDHEAFTNNANCMIEAIIAIISGLSFIQVEDYHEGEISFALVQQQIHAQILKFVRYSSYAISHMQFQVRSGNSPWNDHNFETLMMFLYHFVDKQNFITMGDLEDCLPFAMIHNAALRLYEAQTDAGKAFLASGEEIKEEDVDA